MPPSTKWLIISLHPDVCKTKGIPVPYVVVSQPELAALYSGNVAFNGCLTMTFASQTTACQGDDAGDAGVKSGTVGELCTPVNERLNLRINGCGALAVGDLFHMNLGNTVGKVIVVPAIAHPNSPGALGDAEFDRQVAEMIVGTLEKNEGDSHEAADALYELRNGGMEPPWDPVEPEVYNNPVVVAAEHFLVAYNMGNGFVADAMVFIWERSKYVPPLHNAIKRIATSGIIPGYKLSMNESNLPSDYDPRVQKWADLGQKMSRQGKMGIASTAAILAGLANDPEPVTPIPTPPAKTLPEPVGAPAPTPTPIPLPGPTPC
jgi:hypothetical protein